MRTKNNGLKNDLFILKKDLINAYYVFVNNCVDRNYLTSLFAKDKYLLGLNPYNNKEVFVFNKDLSYIIYKHGKDIPKNDLFNMERVLNYDLLFKNSGKTNDELNGYRFYKRSLDNHGWIEGATKSLNNDEEIFHFQYLGEKSFRKKTHNIEDKLIENKYIK